MLWAHLTPFFIPIAMVSVFLIVNGIFLIARKSERDRPKWMKAAALELKFNFQKKGKIPPPSTYGSFCLFRRGENRKLVNCIEGTVTGIDAALFDYTFTLKSGKSSKEFKELRQTVVIFHLGKKKLPRFEIVPFYTKKMLPITPDFKDITDQNISLKLKSSRLRAKNPKEVLNLFDFELCRFFDHHPGSIVEGGGNWLAVYKVDRRVSPSEIESFVQDAAAFSRHLKKVIR